MKVIIAALLVALLLGVGACYQELLLVRQLLSGSCMDDKHRVIVYRLALEKVTQQKFLKGDYVLEASRQLAREEAAVANRRTRDNATAIYDNRPYGRSTSTREASRP